VWVKPKSMKRKLSFILLFISLFIASCNDKKEANQPPTCKTELVTYTDSSVTIKVNDVQQIFVFKRKDSTMVHVTDVK
jgi:hypothetical protein